MQLVGVLDDIADLPHQRVLVQQIGALLADVRAELVTDRLVQVLRQLEAEVGEEMRTRVLAAEDEHALVRGGHHGRLPRELGMLLHRRRDGLLGLLDRGRGLVRLAQRLADRRRLLLPGHAVVVVLLGLRDHGGELRQRLVLLLGEPAVHGQDQVRLERGDLLHLRSGAGVLEHRRGLGPGQLVLGPRADGALVATEPLRGADRDRAEGEDRVLVGETHGDDPLRLGLDRRTAVLVGEGDREGGGAGAARLRVGFRRTGVRVVVTAGRGGGEEQEGGGERGGEPWSSAGAEHR